MKQNSVNDLPVEEAVKAVVGNSRRTRDFIQSHLMGIFTGSEIDEAIKTVLKRLRIRIIRN